MTAASRIKGRVLVVDDEPKVCAALGSLLEIYGYQVESALNGQKALEVIAEKEAEEGGFDAVLLDLVMPGMDGLSVLEVIARKWPQLPVIMLSGHGTIARAVEAIRLGAFDFLEKPIESERILIALENAIRKYRLEKEREVLIQTALERFRMVGVSRAMEDIFRLIEKVAPTDAKVLITGESGTGKELVARAIHLRSERAAGPFLVVNCAAIPEELIESELFGHEKGAFTGASEKKLGKFELAHQGTLFLDEIGDMSPRLQSKVLRAIEYEEIQRVGGRQSIRVDTRIICASNRDLREAVRQKTFREDLYFRISVIKIHIPPLRERPEDIPVLTEYFMRMFCEERKREKIRITPEAMNLLVNYRWPGNVRELKNLVEKVVVLHRGEVLPEWELRKYLEESSMERKIGAEGREEKAGRAEPAAEGKGEAGKEDGKERSSKQGMDDKVDDKVDDNMDDNNESGAGGDRDYGEDDERKNNETDKFWEGDEEEGSERRNGGEIPTLDRVREKAEREFILSRLQANGWNYEKTAAELGVSRATLFNKLRRYRIRRP